MDILRQLVRMNLLQMKIAKYFILVFLFILFLSSCNEKRDFSSEAWLAKDVDGFYPYRKHIVEDLMSNYLKKGLCIKEIKEILGESVIVKTNMDGHLFYEIETKYGSDIDPDWIKFLDIILDSDSCFFDAQIIKLN